MASDEMVRLCTLTLVAAFDPFGKLINILQHEMNRGHPNKALQRTRSRSGRVFRRLVSLATA